MAIGVIRAKELREKLSQTKDQLVLVDVREPWEHETARIEGAVLIPLRSLPSRINELPLDKEIVFYCHHGVRSMRACELAAQQGFGRVTNLQGGIEAWSTDVDPNVPQY
jgi:adenylyltransferase/sulfurtransferase